MLLCQARLRGSRARGRWFQVAECAVDSAGEVAFEAAERFAAAFSFGLFTLEVGAGRRMMASLGDRDPVQRAVELTVAGAVQAVALLTAAGSVERGGSGMQRELGIAAEAFDAGGLGEQLGGRQSAAAGQRQERGRLLIGGCPTFCVSGQSVSEVDFE